MVCFLQCFKIIVVLHRYIFLLSQQGEFIILKRVCGPSLGCWLLSCRTCKVINTYFPGVSFRTLRKHFEGFLSFENYVEQKEGGKIIFFQVWINIGLIYQMSIFVPVSDAIFILENRIFII